MFSPVVNEKKMANFGPTFCLIVALCVATVFADGKEQANCTASKTCGECIRQSECMWCADPNNGDKCQNQTITKCPKKFIINPNSSSTALPIKQESPSKKKNNKKDAKKASKNIITVTPQFVNITLRPNRPLRIKLHYHHAPDYPLDVYYLKDMSGSGLPQKLNNQLAILGKKLRQKLIHITRDLRLGYGSFVEKPEIPFAFGEEYKSKALEDRISPYDFQNHLALTDNDNLFTDTVNSAHLSSNRDTTEAGLDAIMQIAVCGEKIGWRNVSRKLLIYSSDATFHIAGDGKLVSVLRPNDGCCHLDKQGFYTEALNQDYPSIAQVRSKLMEDSIYLIFVVTENRRNFYKELEKIIDQTYVFTKDDKVIDFISELYENATSEIKIEADYQHNEKPDLKIKYYSKCSKPTGSLLNTNKCQRLKINDTIEFELDIQLLSCPNDSSKWNQQFYIKPRGVNEKMTINLKMLCDCECGTKDKTLCEEHSSQCSNHGRLEFGVCQCDEGYSGHNCSCPFKKDDISKCQTPFGVICSNRGTCECNECHCTTNSPTEVYWGQFCECSNFSCPLNQAEKYCSGNGNCVCGECVCNKGWSGEDCSCETNNNTNCLTPDGEICSGHGNCECNKCICNETAGYYGKFCEKCSTCQDIYCDKLKDCVLCRIQEKKNCAKVCSAQTEMIDDLADLYQTGNECAQFDSQNCKIMFSYHFMGKQINVRILQKRICNTGAPPILTFVIGVIAAIVLIGFLCLMLWKIFAVIQDRREFSKFEEERAKAMWKDNQNPLYVSPSMSYPNPMFEDSSQWAYKEAKKD